jgi:5-(aminomethyl)-3-furanmethanol phosphate kinase
MVDDDTASSVAPAFSQNVEAVVKVGGSLLANVSRLDTVLDVLARLSGKRRLVIVPGGGPFADAVRDVDHRIELPHTAAHWMAVLAMDQYGHLLVARLRGGVLVSRPSEITAALQRGRLPVVAPSRWLREADPLPHSWDVTSDSVAAWIAGALGAARLVLVKADGAQGSDLVDAYFHRALPSGVTSMIIPADRIEELALALH